MPENVRCTVSNCVYWDEGNRCGAETILITTNDKLRFRDDKMEIGALSETLATTSTETNCKTFKPKKSTTR